MKKCNFFFLKKERCIYFREKEREYEQREGQRETERISSKTSLSMEPDMGLDLMTLRDHDLS